MTPAGSPAAGAVQSRIRLLPDDLVARIAAGEVVDRPASILKELIENSLDAGAATIRVEVEGAGRTLIKISDDGSGMTAAEIPLALRRHATSKISRLEDLESIGSFGFRGEALPSIAAVSRLTLLTRSPLEENGWRVEVEGGKILSQQPAARDPGTTIEVRDVFFNTPARFKFLKTDSTERSQCLRVAEEMIFGTPSAAFTLQMEKGRPAAFAPLAAESPIEKASALRTRVTEAWGMRWSRTFELAAADDAHFSMHGVVSHPGQHQATARHQFLYINRRPVQNRRLTRAVYEAFKGQLPSMRHPAWVLFLNVDPRTVDVNVHPAKREVKLTHESELFEFLLASIRRALAGASGGALHADSPAIWSPPAGTPPAARERSASYSETGPSRKNSGFEARPAPSPDLFSTESPRPATTPPESAGRRGKSARAVAQLQNLFIVAESEESMVIVDQHAAAERTLYERLFRNLRSSDPAVQMLLTPYSWEVSASLKTKVAGQLTLLNAMGFAIEAFGGDTFLVKGYPSVLGHRFDLSSLLDGMTDSFDEDGSSSRSVDYTHAIAASLACKAAVKAGDKLDLKECQKILDDLAACEAGLTCPHGRPTFLTWDFHDVKRRFRRF